MESVPSPAVELEATSEWTEAAGASPRHDSFRAHASAQTRLRLQQQAPSNLRRHLVRSVRRVLVLLLADVSSVLLLRVGLRAVRDRLVLGSAVGHIAGMIFPPGRAAGPQFVTALIIALAATGNYARGDQWRDAHRLLIASALAAVLPVWVIMWTGYTSGVLLQYTLRP